MAKLTLSVNDTVVARAKRYAKARGVSISKMVEAYLSAVAEPPVRQQADTPILRSLRGVVLDVLLARQPRAETSFVVTRDPKGFRGSPVQAIAPEAILPMLDDLL